MNWGPFGPERCVLRAGLICVRAFGKEMDYEIDFSCFAWEIDYVLVSEFNSLRSVRVRAVRAVSRPHLDY